MTIKSIQTNAKTPSDTVVPQLRQEKKVCNHKNQRNEDPTPGDGEHTVSPEGRAAADLNERTGAE